MTKKEQMIADDLISYDMESEEANTEWQYIDIGDCVKRYREDNNISMQQFADRAGLSKGYISMLEHGRNPQSKRKLIPSLETASKVAKAMDMSLNDLVRKVGNNQAETKDIIREKRIERNMTMKELANAVGVSEATISRWESGDISNMRKDKIARLSKILGIDVNAFVGLESKEPNTEVKMIAQEILDRPELKILFDASKDVNAEDIIQIAQLLKKLKGRNV